MDKRREYGKIITTKNKFMENDYHVRKTFNSCDYAYELKSLMRRLTLYGQNSFFVIVFFFFSFLFSSTDS